MQAQLAAADAGIVEEVGANCCYAKSDKYWVTDPAGVAWRRITRWTVFRYSAQTRLTSQARRPRAAHRR